jgi:hypothetical protein
VLKEEQPSGGSHLDTTKPQKKSAGKCRPLNEWNGDKLKKWSSSHLGGETRAVQIEDSNEYVASE